MSCVQHQHHSHEQSNNVQRSEVMTNKDSRKPLFSHSMDDDGADDEEPSLAPTDASWDRSRSTSNDSSSPSPPPTCPPQNPPMLHDADIMKSPRTGCSSWEDTKENNPATSSDCKTVALGRPPKTPDTSSDQLLGFGFRPFLESLTDYLCPIDNGTVTSHRWPKTCCMYCSDCDCFRPCVSCSTGRTDDGSLVSRSLLDKEVERLRKILQVEIGHLMGSTSTKAKEWLDTLRDWLFGFAVATSNPTNGDVDNVQRILHRNRAYVMNAQEKRMRRLRNDMYFAKTAFPPGRAAYGVDGHVPIQYTKSLDGFYNRHYSTQTIGANGQCQMFTLCNPTQSTNTSMSGGFLKGISGDHVYENANPTDEHSLSNCNDSYYYDSDPGEARCRHRAPRRATSVDPNVTNKRRPLVETLIDDHDADNESACASLSGSDDEDVDRSGAYEELVIDVKNDELVIKFTRELTNGNVTLVWHPSNTQNNNNCAPICVQAWFEMGSRLRDKVIQPKFMWWAAYQPNIDSKKLSISSHTPESVELLNIVRVLKPTFIDRKQHPFAKQRNSFTVQSNTNDVYLFEAFSEKERDRFVQGLKLVVARLASKIIVGDEDVFDEFFTPWGQSISPNALENSGSTDTESLGDSLDSFDNDGDDLFFKTEGKEIFRASPVFNK